MDDADPKATLSTARALATQGRYREAIELLNRAYAGTDPFAAYHRALWAMPLGAHDEVIGATDVAIGALLRPRVTVAGFIAGVLGGDAPATLLRYSRRDIARTPQLRRPVVLRWEALCRSARWPEARQLRALCLKLWPERVSVWEAAGNQALDEADAAEAERYFEHALALDATSTAALAGLAAAHEQRKDWPGALELRKRVADLEEAWTRADPASLHRVIRFAADLGRLSRWREAEPHLRRAVELGAFGALPPERPVLLRVFSRDLYAPALVARMFAELPEAQQQADPEALFALGDAIRLADSARRLREQGLPAHTLSLALGLCAWEAGDVEAAYRAFDAVDSAQPEQMQTSYLLMVASDAASTADRASLREQARVLAARCLTAAAVTDVDRCHALLTGLTLGEQVELPAPDGSGPFVELLRAVLADRASPEPSRAYPRLASGDLVELLSWDVVLRQALVATGRPPGLAARLSARGRAAA